MAARSVERARARPGGRAGIVAQALADPATALLLAVVVMCFAVCIDVLHDPDLWWHLRMGHLIIDTHAIPRTEPFSYTATGHALTAHEWLSEVLFAVLDGAGGLLLVATAVALVTWSGFVALALRLRARGASPLAAALTLLAGAKAAEPVLGTRPQVLTFALTCWMLVLLERHLRRGGRGVWWLPAIVLVWANLHAGFVTGIAVAVIVLVAAWLAPRFGDPGEGITAAERRTRLRTLAAAIGASVLAAMVNPAGPSLYRFAIAVSATESRKAIVEWQSPNFHDGGELALLVVIAATVALIGMGGRVSLADGALAGAGCLLALVAVRNSAISVALLVPALGALLDRPLRVLVPRLTEVRRRAGPPRPAAIAVGALVVCAGLVVAGSAFAGAAADTTEEHIAAAYPACAVRALLAAGAPVHAFVPYGTGGFVIDRAWPRVRVFEYGESISLGDQVFADYERISSGDPDALSLLARSGTTAVMTGRGALSGELAASGAWRHMLDDGGLQLWVATASPANATPSHC